MLRMGNYRADNDNAEWLYRDRVRRRLLRSRDGLSFSGCIGLLLAFALAVLAYEIPIQVHSNTLPQIEAGNSHRD
jgi:hypothetical protein